jgi:hypothetical protein
VTFQPIQSRERAKQLISFEGMDLGPRLWPTDFDAAIEWKDRAWLLFEVKHGEKAVPLGQRLALERFVRDVWRGGKKAVAAVVEHYIADPSEDVRLADCQVREVFVGGEFVWRATRRCMTAWELTDAYTRYAGRRCA